MQINNSTVYLHADSHLGSISTCSFTTRHIFKQIDTQEVYLHADIRLYSVLYLHGDVQPDRTSSHIQMSY